MCQVALNVKHMDGSQTPCTDAVFDLELLNRTVHTFLWMSVWQTIYSNSRGDKAVSVFFFFFTLTQLLIYNCGFFFLFLHDPQQVVWVRKWEGFFLITPLSRHITVFYQPRYTSSSTRWEHRQLPVMLPKASWTEAEISRLPYVNTLSKTTRLRSSPENLLSAAFSLEWLRKSSSPCRKCFYPLHFHVFTGEIKLSAHLQIMWGGLSTLWELTVPSPCCPVHFNQFSNFCHFTPKSKWFVHWDQTVFVLRVLETSNLPKHLKKTYLMTVLSFWSGWINL